MSYRLAKSLIKLRAQINERWPTRSKMSDGWIGDAKHSSRVSDHNPNKAGVVCAIDITHDPANGLDSYQLADVLLKDQDVRLKYIISNKKIGSGQRGAKPGQWRGYSGSNKHAHHVHISVDALVDDEKTWDLAGTSTSPDHRSPEALPIIRRGSKSEAVGKLQRLLGVDDDWDFGPKTERALRLFQRKKKLLVDGIAGPQVWNALGVEEL